MRLRLQLLAVPLLVAALAACSSNDDGPASSGPNACLASGGVCQGNFPFLCAPGYQAATNDGLGTACGMSTGDNPQQVPCCMESAQPPQDTGVDSTPDTSTQPGDAATDSSSDGAKDGAGDAPADATDAGDALAVDATEAG